MRHTLKWFLDRQGKRIYRKKLSCPCKDCQKEYVDIADGQLGITHANYIKTCQDEMGIRYSDKPHKSKDAR